MQISIFKGKDATQSRDIDRTIDVTFDTIGEHITKHMWAPGIFANSIRSIPTFRSTRLLVLDIDDGCTIEEAKKILSPYAHIIATTKSHMKSKNGKTCERFRVVLFLDGEITNDKDYKATWFTAQKICPAMDPACKDSARFFYPCVDLVHVSPGSLFPITIAQLQEAPKPAEPLTITKKGLLSKRAWKFLTDGAVNGQWHGERNNFVRECKQNNYSFDEMVSLFKMHHQPDATDEFQFEDIWNRGVKHAARTNETNLEDELLKIILRSKFVVDVAHPNITKLVDLTTGSVHDVHRDIIASKVGRKEYLNYMMNNGVEARFDYDPYRMSVFYLDQDNITNYNTYNPPKWKSGQFWFDTPVTSVEKIPEIYEKFLLHLTDNHLPSYEYLLDWLAVSLTGRNLTFLTAIGKQGVGKGTLGDIMQLLHGESNFVKVRDQIFKAQFNSPLRNKTLVYVDEIELKTKESQDRIKDVANSLIEIEAKGMDAVQTKNCASYYLSSNTMDAVKIEAGDRRFSIIQLTDKQIVSTDMSGQFINRLKQQGSITELARYLIGRKIEREMYVPFKSPRYEEVREAGLADWELYVIEDWAPLNRGKEIPLSVLADDLIKSQSLNKAPGRRKLKALAEKYPDLLKITTNRQNVWCIRVN